MLTLNAVQQLILMKRTKVFMCSKFLANFDFTKISTWSSTPSSSSSILRDILSSTVVY